SQEIEDAALVAGSFESFDPWATNAARRCANKSWWYAGDSIPVMRPGLARSTIDHVSRWQQLGLFDGFLKVQVDANQIAAESARENSDIAAIPVVLWLLAGHLPALVYGELCPIWREDDGKS